MKFEIFRCGTQFCWRLLDGGGKVLCQSATQWRSRSTVEENILKIMDGAENAEIVDKTQVNSRERTQNEKVRTPNGRTRAKSTAAAA